MGTGKKYELHGGAILVVDTELGPFRYHPRSSIPEPTVELFFKRGKVTQEAASKAASRVMQATATVTNTRIQLCTRAKVQGWNDAIALCDAFVEELNRILSSRERVVASSRGRRAAVRSEMYRNDPANH